MSGHNVFSLIRSVDEVSANRAEAGLWVEFSASVLFTMFFASFQQIVEDFGFIMCCFGLFFLLWTLY
jgi:hypothetical protein